MWRELLASARNRGVSAARKWAAPDAATYQGQEDAMSSPQGSSGDSPPPGALQTQPPAPAPVAPNDDAPFESDNVSRETSDETDTPIGAAAERAMRGLPP